LTVGLILGLVAGRVVGIKLLRATFAGGMLGAVIGSLYRQEPHLSADEFGNLMMDLTGGRSGVIVQIDRGQADKVTDEIVKLDGLVKKYHRPAGSAHSVPTQPVSAA
jgi:uncharacterized membrane protein